MHGSGLMSRLRSGVRLFMLAGVVMALAVLLLSYGTSPRERDVPRLMTEPTPTALLGNTVPARLRPWVTAAMRAHRCSIQPVPTTSQAWSALVIVEDSVRHVSQDEGWAIFTGTRPGRFVALCRGAVQPKR